MAATAIFSLVRLGSPTWKENLSRYMMGAYRSSWAGLFCNGFDRIYGARIFNGRLPSIKRLFASALSSLLAVGAIYFLSLLIFDNAHQRFGYTPELWKIFAAAAILNLIPDYISIAQTRWILGRLAKAERENSEKENGQPGGALAGILRPFGYLALDFFLSLFIILAALVPFFLLVREQPFHLSEIVMGYSFYSIFFYSTFLTSLLAWIYGLSLFVMRAFDSLGLNRALNVEGMPAAVLSAVAACLVFLFTTAFVFVQEKAVASGFLDASHQCELDPDGLCLHAGRLSSEPERLLTFFQAGCDGGDWRSCEWMSTYLRTHKSRPDEDYLAHRASVQGCEYGSPAACLGAGLDLFPPASPPSWYKPVAVLKNKERATAFYLKACNLDLGYGCRLYIDLNWKNDPNIHSYLEKYCALSPLQGCNMLGEYLLDEGDPVTDVDTAQALFQSTCEQGSNLGCAFLGLVYWEKLPDGQNRERAVGLWKAACDGGYPWACGRLGTAYRDGELGVNLPRALYYFQKACALRDGVNCDPVIELRRQTQEYLNGPLTLEDTDRMFWTPETLILNNGARNFVR